MTIISSKKTIFAIAAFSVLFVSFFGAKLVKADSPFGVIYGDASRAEEMMFLDDLAIFLKRNPEMVGHLVYFSSERHSAQRMKTRTDWAVKYLVNKRNVDRKRLVVYYGGTNQLSKLVLQPIRRGLKPPFESVPTPRISSIPNPSHKQ